MLAQPALAVELVPGGYTVDDESIIGPISLSMSGSFADRGSLVSLPFSFTPRAGAVGLVAGQGADLPSLALNFVGAERLAGSLRLDSIGLAGSGLSRSHDRGDNEDLLVGGALFFDNMAISGHLGRAELQGVDADVLSAGVSYGPVSARLVYGRMPDDARGNDVVMFSTDLAAWSWLTLEGDVAFSDRDDTDDLAVGRLGVRFNF